MDFFVKNPLVMIFRDCPAMGPPFRKRHSYGLQSQKTDKNIKFFFLKNVGVAAAFFESRRLRV